ncbi:acyl-CoA dehydrogenase family protein [Fluviispira sanaruensis]|uniref:Acyl-CoA dehydrogenase n=1 Tax=Fluviispira sanaruensis TaxID=2493639 RepID=A0A4P2VG65_FLUSA|nr:acyl-CoA dehydrogenase family protein [Fluviispira sanaruensis]BBH51706.1 acyl-CoA dehydrogenase [Fluviispira sanaruensis]
MSGNTKFSFMKSIFNGHISEKSLHHYPFFNTNRENDYTLMANSINDWMKQNVDSLKFDQEKKLPKEIIQGMKEMGLFGLIIPEAFGGSEFTQTFYTRTLELLNKHDASVTLTAGAHSSIGLKGLYLYGNEKQKAKYMPKLATGEMIASFALTEPTAGSDAAGIKTRAVKQGDHYVINGSKLWITNGGFADFFTVFAKEEVNGEDKITAFIVTRDMGGVTHGSEELKLGIKASSTVEVFFKDVKVPAENILGKSGDGFKIAMGILNQGRMGLAGGALGAMKSAMDECITYTKNRKAFGHSISDFGLIQSMLSEMAMHIYASESATYFATNLVDSGDTDYSIEAAICKVFVTEASWATINTAMQIHGGNGYMVEYGIERKLRDGRIGLIFEGTNEILRLFIAMTGLKEPASQYQRLGKELQSLQNIKSVDFLNSAIGKIGFLSEFAFSEVKKSVLTEKLEGFHPALEKECERLSTATHALTTSASKLIRTYGHKLVDEQLQLSRLADIAIDTYVISSVLSRINSVLEKHGGPEKNEAELTMAKLIIRNAKARINQNIYNLKANHDDKIKIIAKKLIDTEKYPFAIDNFK